MGNNLGVARALGKSPAFHIGLLGGLLVGFGGFFGLPLDLFEYAAHHI
jgi:hypothetical protein